MPRLFALIILLATFPPLSTDMYLAAIPLMVARWQQPVAIVNLSLVLFFVAYCFFLLLYGPLSDKYGRRPPLLAGLGLYCLASLICGAADNVFIMIFGRTLQGAGAAAATSIAYAICKDLFDGQVRQRMFVRLGVIVAGAPMIAPALGGWLIEAWSWRLIFVVQAMAGVVALAGVWAMKEPLQVFSRDSFYLMYRGYFRLFTNRPFIMLTLSFACSGIPFFMYLGCSSEIFISQLGYSEKVYGYFYGANASAFMLAPLTFTQMYKRFSLKVLLPVSFCGMMICATPMLLQQFGDLFRLVMPMWLLTFFFSFGRPPSSNLLLEQVQSDIGAASSLMIFTFFLIGAMMMWFISFGWHDKITIIGWSGVLAPAISLSGWIVANRMFALKFV